MIPIIEVVPEKKGYWEVYLDKKIWRDESYWYDKMKFKDHKEVAKKHGIGGGWLRLQTGDNKVRIVSEIEDYGSHYDSKNKRSVVCLGKDKCELCQKREDLVNDGVDAKSPEIQALRVRVQFLFWVIDRTDNLVKLLQTGYTVFQQIGVFAENEEYGFDVIPDYDMNIQKSGEGLETKYTVVPSRKSVELTEEEKKQIEEKVKDPKEIIKSMKAKISDKEEGEEEIDVKDIPF